MMRFALVYEGKNRKGRGTSIFQFVDEVASRERVIRSEINGSPEHTRALASLGMYFLRVLAEK